MSDPLPAPEPPRMFGSSWTPDSWRARPASQQLEWPDDAGRKALREIHERSIHELEGVLSPDLREELCEVVLPFKDEAPTESEVRLAQAQLVGWLEGLFQGIQATLFTQQMAAQGQFDEMRRRAIESGQAPPQAPPGSGYL